MGCPKSPKSPPVPSLGVFRARLSRAGTGRGVPAHGEVWDWVGGKAPSHPNHFLVLCPCPVCGSSHCHCGSHLFTECCRRSPFWEVLISTSLWERIRERIREGVEELWMCPMLWIQLFPAGKEHSMGCGRGVAKAIEGYQRLPWPRGPPGVILKGLEGKQGQSTEM